ncbi:MAG: hypothetical protein WDW38_010626 [Sanguina aurantia]
MAPNYMLHEVLAATSSSSASSLDAVAAHVAVISAQVAVLQLDNTRRDALAAAANTELHSMHMLIQALCSSLHAQQQHQQPLIPTSVPQQAPHHHYLPLASQLAPPPGFPSPATQSFAAVAQAGASSVSSAPSPAFSRPAVHVDAESLEQFFTQVNSSTLPSTFDLCGRTLYHQISDLPAADTLVTASNITIRNGTLHQSDTRDLNGPGLHVQGVGVKLEGLVLIGGGYGVRVLPGGRVKMSGCAVINAFTGIGVGGFGLETPSATSHLVARDVKVTGSARRGLSVGKGGEAKVRSCEFSNGLHHGMFVGGDVSSKLTATDVCCNGNRKHGLCVVMQGKATLRRCNLMDNASGSLLVQDPQSSMMYSQCRFDTQAQAINGGYMHEVHHP